MLTSRLMLPWHQGCRQRGLHKMLLQLQGLPVDSLVELLFLLCSWLHEDGQQSVGTEAQLSGHRH